MANKHPGYMTTFKERLSYWTYFIGQNIYYNITAAFISTYRADFNHYRRFELGAGRSVRF